MSQPQSDRHLEARFFHYPIAIAIGSLLFGVCDVLAGYSVPGPELGSQSDTLALVCMILGTASLAGIIGAAAFTIFNTAGHSLGKVLGRKSLTWFLLFLVASFGFIVVNKNTFDGGRISNHARITEIIWGFRIVGVLAIGIGIKVLGSILKKTQTSTVLNTFMALLFSAVGGAALWLNVVKLPGLYPMLHTQLAAIAWVSLVVGPGSWLARHKKISLALICVALGLIVAAAMIRSSDTNIGIGSAVGARGRGTQEFHDVTTPGFDLWRPAATLDLSEPPIGDLPGNDAEAEKIANAWFRGQLEAKKKYNVLFLAVDTLRADHCGFNGYEVHKTTPHMDKMAKDAFVFRHAYSAYPTSNYSYSSVFTGLYARATPVFGRIKKKDWKFGPDVPIAGLLGSRGWNTVGINAFNRNNAFDDNWFGLLRAGFSIYNPDQGESAARANEISDSVVKQIDLNNGQPFLLWAQYLDPHSPYEKWDGFDFGDSTTERYDSEIAFADDQIGRVLDHLEKRGDLDRTIVIMFADHGEEFGEHAGWDHNTSLYDEQTRVPLVIRIPGVKGRTIDSTVSLVDVVPTLTALLGIDDPEKRLGRNLLPIMYSGGANDPGYAYADHFVAVGGKDTNSKRMLVQGKSKLIHSVQKQSYELYDLGQDPGEKRNLIASRRADFERLGGLMAALNAKIDDYHLKEGEVRVDPATAFKAEIDGALAQLASTNKTEVNKGSRKLKSLLLDYIGNLAPNVSLYLSDDGVADLTAKLIGIFQTSKISNAKTAVVQLIAEMRHKSGREFLKEVAKSKSRISNFAIAGLARQGIDVNREQLRIGLEVPSSDAAAAAIALAALGDPAANPWIAPCLTSPSWKVVGQMIQALPGLTFPNVGYYFRDLLAEGLWRPKPVQYALAESLGDIKNDPDAHWMMLMLAAGSDPTVRDYAKTSLTKAGLSQTDLDRYREAIKSEWEAQLEIKNRAFDQAILTIDKSLAANPNFNAALRLRKARYLHLIGRVDEARKTLEEVVAKGETGLDRKLAKRRIQFLPYHARIEDEDHKDFSLVINKFTAPKKVWPGRPFMLEVEIENKGKIAIQGGYWLHASKLLVMWRDKDGKILPQRNIQNNFFPDRGLLPGEKTTLQIVAYPASHSRQFTATPVVAFAQPWFRHQDCFQVGKKDLYPVVIYEHDQTIEATVKGYPKPKPPTKKTKKKPVKKTSKNTTPFPSGLIDILGQDDLDADVAYGVIHPSPPIYVTDNDGTPIVSEAGYLQLADQGPGFYYGATVAERIDWARRIKLLHTNNWGDIETLCYADRIVERWLDQHPQGPRLGIDEISGRFGGFPDYDNDGISDHKTHQTGRNINFLMPCPSQPEKYIHLGVKHDDLFQPQIFREMLEILVEEGAYRFTTNLLTKAVDPSFKYKNLEWKRVAESKDGYSQTYQQVGGKCRMYLLTKPGDHGDHVNTMLWKIEK